MNVNTSRAWASVGNQNFIFHPCVKMSERGEGAEMLDEGCAEGC